MAIFAKPPTTPQRTVWTAFSARGLGCNLQHYNYIPDFTAKVASQWNIPVTWKLKAQLVFGEPTAGPDKAKKFKPVMGERVIVHGE